jgi:hypothetical protein
MTPKQRMLPRMSRTMLARRLNDHENMPLSISEEGRRMKRKEKTATNVWCGEWLSAKDA